jgi:hypothetical protein
VRKAIGAGGLTRETWHERLIGAGIGVGIGLFVAFVGVFFETWWNSPSSQSGMILVTDNEYTERTRSVETRTGRQLAESNLFVVEYQFNNIQNDLKNFAFLIPIKSRTNAAILVETEQNTAILKSVSNLSEIQSLGRVKVDVQSMERGGRIIVRLKSKEDIDIPIFEAPSADVKTIQILTPDTLYYHI